jgi:hypothetical protein
MQADHAHDMDPLTNDSMTNALQLARARRAYELGRLLTSARKALYVVVPVAIVAALTTGPEALVWLPVTFVAWVIAQWRGGPLLRGSFFGLVGGAVTHALPMTVLRPCCSPAAMKAGMECCTMPGACLAAGGLVGLALAAFVPAGSARWRMAGGMALGVASVAILRCATLFAGEAVGLVAGLVVGVLAATTARRVLATT